MSLDEVEVSSFLFLLTQQYVNYTDMFLMLLVTILSCQML